MKLFLLEIHSSDSVVYEKNQMNDSYNILDPGINFYVVKK